MTDTARPYRPGSLRSLLTGVLSLLLNRAQLAELEAQEHWHRLLSYALLAGITLLSAVVALVALLLFLAVILPPAWRAPVLAGTALLFCLIAAASLWRLAWRLAHAPVAFAATRAELQKDWQLLSNKEPS
jgi:uncharacterized membrane protein YqjE